MFLNILPVLVLSALGADPSNPQISIEGPTAQIYYENLNVAEQSMTSIPERRTYRKLVDGMTCTKGRNMMRAGGSTTFRCTIEEDLTPNQIEAIYNNLELNESHENRPGARISKKRVAHVDGDFIFIRSALVAGPGRSKIRYYFEYPSAYDEIELSSVTTIGKDAQAIYESLDVTPRERRTVGAQSFEKSVGSLSCYRSSTPGPRSKVRYQCTLEGLLD
ncbi:MAG: hypothetical protein COU07_02390 [Candidatus Harrisonbacteria bacterium CG10_big_fil_rev_8_21_14_0_10_40_38]|uniref:Uncharacterized protein n=1 Tax=Candidatus Harrisonbacteria bacterium CG10_big_fil_rev_8_21_14_0_10_40_38 TaxID=1974583 RepID=A0A2H0UTS5_9BACT|nr:MAG: hypothetical protein COU07_02390 [Candidatus Harrisonbacteria bacterium CG10_big_fil_rev_8_21_14_0_10_40_38]